MTTLEPALPAPVLIVEDDALIRLRLLGVLRSLGYSEDALDFVASLGEARAYARSQPLALALVDIGLPDGSGIELIRELRAADPGLSVLVISAWSTQATIIAAIQAGATGYVLKERDDLEVSLSIRSVLCGGAPIDPFIAHHILRHVPTQAQARVVESATAELSAREREILDLVAQGLTNREIAERLTISRYTVECHIKHIYRKLAVPSRTRAVNEARQRGLLS
ncbi:DNA-binding response regulator [Stutzerimonas kirkiae]|uniref:DNA-binding response regulator n=1 Tax=Stutzerimonas kirkiae TaxID=2211392 RepID=A0A4Q9QYZ0_9GAMM|nr:response regulator transcription factor [Stutzerimonas kirkiae]TBU89516.1 DNA-binding response regulator [Stutzerimonas kirkiae]TBU98705.1 DNA-binding response regulator [Stutzerimonas kirkiae]TBV13751.1 DNA-binding response regulator [Stutzerimonas kirkiae]